MTWFKVIKEDKCCKRIRTVMSNSPDFGKLKHDWEMFNCSELRNYLKTLESYSIKEGEVNWQLKSAATRLLAAWDFCAKEG
jgi:hypothetical protein